MQGIFVGGTVIFAGVADGTVRRFDCITSVATNSISTGLVLLTGDSQLVGSKTSLVHRWKGLHCVWSGELWIARIYQGQSFWVIH